MTVASALNRKTFAGNGVTTSFGTSPVVFFDTSDLVVYVTNDTTGASTTLVENTDYTVSGGAGSTGTVSTAGGSAPYGAPATGYTLVIVREVPLTQETDLVNNDINDAGVMEEALDRNVMAEQQLSSQIDRALRLADSDVSGASTELPTPEASTVIGWDTDGITLVNYPSSDASIVQAELDAHLADTAGAHAASAISFSPTGTVASTDVQSAIAEVSGDASSAVTDIAAHIADTTDAHAGTAITFLQQGTGAIATDVQTALRSFALNVKRYGATGDGSTDDTSAIQAAVDAAEAAGKSLFFPSGTYKITSAITVDADGVGVFGEGPRTSTLVTASVGINGFVFGNGTTTRNGNWARDIGVNTSVTKNAGAAFYLNQVNDFALSNFWIGAPYDGIKIEDSTVVDIRRGMIVNPVGTNGHGILVTGPDTAETYLSHIFISGDSGGQCNAGVRLEEASGVYLNNVGSVYCLAGLRMVPGNGQTVEHVFTTNCAWDSSGAHGCISNPSGTGVMQRFASANDWYATTLSSTTGNGLFIAGGDGFSVVNPRCYNNGGQGIAITGGSNVSVTGGVCAGNSTNSASTYSGIVVSGSPSGVIIKGVRSGPRDGFTNAQKYGIEIQASVTDITVIGNDVRGNTTAGISDLSTTKSKVICNNLGGTGNQTVIESGSIPASANFTISNIPNHYSYLILEIDGWSQGTNTCRLIVRAGTTTADTTAGNYVGNVITGTTVTNFTTNAIASMVDGPTQTTAQTGKAVVNIYGYNTTAPKRFDSRILANTTEAQCFGTFLSATAIDVIKVETNAAGSFDAGTYKLIGVN